MSRGEKNREKKEGGCAASRHSYAREREKRKLSIFSRVPGTERGERACQSGEVNEQKNKEKKESPATSLRLRRQKGQKVTA